MRTGLKVALVGYGGAGRGIHSPLVREAGGVVSAVVVRSPERRAQASADWPGVALYEDVPGVLADAGAYDVLVIASPTRLHVEHALAAADAGVPFVLDKPIATDAVGARRVLAAGAGVPFTVFQNRRWDAENLTLAALLATGELGRVHTFERRWERWRPVPLDRWKENDPVGGGLLLDLGPHLVDSATQFFGPVTGVYAQLRRQATATLDDVFLTLDHETGVISRLWAGSLVAAPGPRTRVLGTGGAYVTSTYENDVSPFDAIDAGAPEGTVGWLVRGGERTPVERAPGSHADFYRAVAAWLDGGPVPVDPADAVRTAEVLDAARESAASGRRVVPGRAGERRG